MKPPVYCLMVTGKDEKRLAFARLVGIPNFDAQDYPNKRMIIVNHGKKKVLDTPRSDIYEILIEKTADMTLGDLRNLSLDLVPIDALWLCFDDDDTRSPDYVSFMVKKLFEKKSIAVFMKNRLEYNLSNGYAFKSHFKRGNTHILSLKLDRLRYLPIETLEDVKLQEDIYGFKKKYAVIDNDPKMYLRVIHDNNTSPFALDTKKKIANYSSAGNYWESEASAEEKAYAEKIARERYSFFLRRD